MRCVLGLGLCCLVAGCVRVVSTADAQVDSDRAAFINFQDRGPARDGPSRADGPIATDAAPPTEGPVGEDAAPAPPDAAPAPPDAAPAPPAPLTESSASRWIASCNIGSAEPCSSTLADDTALAVDGASSLRWRCDGCSLDNALSYGVATGGCDLSGYTHLELSVRSTLDDPMQAWQNEVYGNTPWLILRDNAGHTLRVEPEPGAAALNASINNWVALQLPLAGGLGWIATTAPGFQRSHVVAIELHVDPWGRGFTLWLDGMRFGPGAFFGC